MIPPDVVPAPGFPDSVARIAAIKKAVLAAKPPRAVFLSSIGGEKTSGLGVVTTAHLLEEAIPLVATEDIGRIGTETLLQTWQGNRFIEISGPTYYSPNDVAAVLEMALGRPVAGVAVPRETWVDTLAEHGMPADRSGASIEMTDSFNSRWIAFGVPGTEHVKGTIDLVTAVKSPTRRAS
jgi:NAD(P)H dehydrogenase (quinone)